MDRFQQSGEEDRLSALTDDVLLYILARVDLRTAARTSALSTWWRQLPWLLPELSINVKDFLPSPHPDPIEENDMVRAMVPLTEAARSLFARPRRGSTIMKLQLKIYLIEFFSSEIGPLLCDAIDTGLLKDMALAVHDEKKLSERCHPDMLSLAKRTYGFFSAYPSVLHCLTRLFLCSMCFEQLDMEHILFDCCNQLKHLTMFNCDAGLGSPWKIDAPNSKLSVLEFNICSFERIEFICLPKLEKLDWDYWASDDAPLSFGSVPSLEELVLSNCFGVTQHALKLSELLYGATCIHTLTLDFQGENVWLQPEIQELTFAFSKLRKLFILGVFVEFDLAWITAFLEAAPCVEMLHIAVYENACEVRNESIYPERTNPHWELDFHGSKNLLLRELQIAGFRPLEQQLTFIRAVLERAPNLQTVVLNKDDEGCEDCYAITHNAPTRPAFPENKEERDMVARRVTNGTSFPVQIIFQL